LTNNDPDPLKRVFLQLKDVPVERFIVFHEDEAAFRATSRKWMGIARKYLGNAFPGASLLGGTNGNFAELNRDRPDLSIMDGVSYPINPQVHSSDEASLIEALETQADTVTTARSFSGSLPIVISSVTLKPPFNQAATEQEQPPLPGELPSSVDQRQMSLFAAAWTVGSLKYLAEAGAASITYYETIGWRGLVERQSGSLVPETFLSSPGMVFPVYHIFADIADFKNADIYNCQSSQPLSVTGLCLHSDHRWQLLIANLKFASQNILVGPLPPGRLKIRSLDESTAALSMVDPDEFHASYEIMEHQGWELTITLKPYGIVKIDWEDLKDEY
jgi:D-apionolactonase